MMPSRLTFGVVDDVEDTGRPPMQVVMSLAEFKAMVGMDGGICWENWLRLRGMDCDGTLLDMKES
jgi:hypothetical protein